MIKIIVILVALQLAVTLHTSHQLQTPLLQQAQHQQTSTNIYFENQFNAIKSQVEYVHRALTLNDTTTYEYLITRTQQIQAGLNQIQATLLKYNLPLTLDDKICPKLTAFNRTELRRYISYTELRQQWMQDYLATCLTCSFVSEDIHKISNLTKTYIAHLNNTLDGVYCNKSLATGQIGVGMVNLNESYFKNNLNANNWYYGSTTQSDYKIYIFKLSSTYNFTSCPIEKPFVKEHQQNCFNCPEGSMFNLGKQACDICKPDQILNTQTASCIKCLGDKVLEGRSLICKLCVISEGFIFNETIGKCQKCNDKSYLDVQNKKCVVINCPVTAPRFNRATNLCQKCGLSEVIDPKNVSQCLKTNYVGLCHPQTPFYDTINHACKACPQNTTYSLNTNQCLPNVNAHNLHLQTTNNQQPNITNIAVLCSSDQPKFNPTTNLCQACQKGFQYNVKLADCMKTLSCSDTQTPDSQHLNCVQTATTCLTNEVYIIKINKCIPKSMTCSEDQFYSKDNNTCLSISSTCKRSEFYDQKIKKCRQISSKCAGNEVFNKNLSVCEKLVLCKDSEHYNSELKICEKRILKCLGSQYIDNVTYTCRNYTRVTSPFAQNLVVEGSYAGYLSEYNKMKEKKDNLVVNCPVSSPFYQKASKTCISCAKEVPYFNIQQDKCISCQDTEQYDSITHKCSSKRSSSELLPSRIASTISRINI